MPSYTRYRDQLLLLKDYIINLTIQKDNTTANYIVRYLPDSESSSILHFHNLLTSASLEIDAGDILNTKSLCLFSTDKVQEIYNTYCVLSLREDLVQFKDLFTNPDYDTLAFGAIISFKDRYNPTFPLTAEFFNPNIMPLVESLMCILFGLTDLKFLDEEVYAFNAATVLAKLIKENAVSQAALLYPDSAEERVTYIQDLEKRATNEEDEDIESIFELKTPREIYTEGWPPLYDFNPIFDIATST